MLDAEEIRKLAIVIAIMNDEVGDFTGFQRSNLITAIRAHASSGSEANGSVALFNVLSETRKQDLLNFLRSL